MDTLDTLSRIDYAMREARMAFAMSVNTIKISEMGPFDGISMQVMDGMNKLVRCYDVANYQWHCAVVNSGLREARATMAQMGIGSNSFMQLDPADLATKFPRLPHIFDVALHDLKCSRLVEKNLDDLNDDLNRGHKRSLPVSLSKRTRRMSNEPILYLADVAAKAPYM